MNLIARLFFCLLLLVRPALALTPEQTWSHLIAHEFSILESGLDALDAQVRAGAVSADVQRAAYLVFRTTHPQGEAALKAWVDALPQSRHARAALIWYNHNLAWISRGQDGGRDTWQPRMVAFQDMMQDAVRARVELFEEDPGFIPASDAMMLALRHTGALKRVLGPDAVPHVRETFLARAMQAAPNSGTIKRALYTYLPQWGGSRAKMRDICARYAPAVLDLDPYDADLCLAYFILDGGLWRQADIEFAREVLVAHWDQLPAQRRFDIAILMYNDPELALESAAHLDKPAITEIRAVFPGAHAKGFHTFTPDQMVLTRIWIENGIAVLEAELARDPYSTIRIDRLVEFHEWYVLLLLGELGEKHGALYSTIARKHAQLTPEALSAAKEAENARYAAERSAVEASHTAKIEALLAAYAVLGVTHVRYWTTRLRAEWPRVFHASVDTLAEHRARDLYAKGALIYGNHQLYRLLELSYVPEGFRRFVAGELRAIEDGTQAATSDALAELLAAREEADCSAVRTARMISAACPWWQIIGKNGMCERGADQVTWANRLLRESPALCPAVRAMAKDQLPYTPADLLRRP